MEFGIVPLMYPYSGKTRLKILEIMEIIPWKTGVLRRKYCFLNEKYEISESHNPKVVGSNPAAATRKLALCNAMGKWLRNPQRLHSANIFCLYFGENRGLWNKNLCRISDLKTIFWDYVANVFFLSCDMKNGSFPLYFRYEHKKVWKNTQIREPVINDVALG